MALVSSAWEMPFVKSFLFSHPSRNILITVTFNLIPQKRFYIVFETSLENPQDGDSTTPICMFLEEMLDLSYSTCSLWILSLTLPATIKKSTFANPFKQFWAAVSLFTI